MAARRRGARKTETTNESVESDDEEAGLATGANAGESAEARGESMAVSSEDILKAIKDMNAEFSTKFENVLSALDSVKKEVGECAGRISEAEVRISGAEDNVTALQATSTALEEKVKSLTSKLIDLEDRSRRSNLRLVHLPEGAEGNDACSFLEQWLPDALEMGPLRSPLVIERAHRIAGPRSDPNAPPRALIMKFLNFRDKESVMKAARAKGRVLYKSRPVMFFPDLSTEVHKRRRRFDSVKQRLRAKAIRYGIIYPARLRVSYEERSYIFETPAEAEKFLEKLGRGGETEGR